MLRIEARGIEENARAFRQAGRGELTQELRSAFRWGAQKALTEGRREVRGIRISSSGSGGGPPSRSTGLRRGIADQMTVSVRLYGTHAGYTVKRRGPIPGHGRSTERLPFYSDNVGRWRAPTFGHSPWHTMRGQDWYAPSQRRAADMTHDNLLERVTKICRRLD